MRTIATRIDRRFQLSAWFVYEDGPLVQWLRDAGVDARFVPFLPGLRNPAGPLHLWAACRRQRPALVHHHSADARVRWVLKHATGVPILFHLHGRAVETKSPAPATVATRYADRVITVSNAVAAFTRTASEVVYTGIEMGPVGPRSRNDGPVVVGTACRFVPLKGVDRLLRAFAIARQALPDLRLEIAGEGDGRSHLERQASDLGLRDAVKFLGWQSDVRATMRNWSIYVQPSLEEGLPLSVIEAMAEQLPVVATRVGGIPEVVVDGQTGCLVPPGDESALASRIVALASDAGMRAGMAERGRARAQEKFSAGQFVSRIAKIYGEMLSGPPSPSL